MKHSLVLVLGLVLALSLGGQVFAQTQIAFTGTNYASATLKAMPIDQNHVVLIGEQMGLEVNDKAPFNNLSTHFALIIFFDNGAQHMHGYGTYVDKDGDKFIVEIWDFPSGSPAKGKGKVVGATGKFTGMEGTADFVTQSPGGWPQGTSRLICQENWKLTLKNPM
jgi:hypothetical protein